ncbi:hypothetical protein [Coxiella-like endosymbiont of Rhipicephalus sanguineus]
MGIGAVNVLFTIISLPLIDWLGRASTFNLSVLVRCPLACLS